MKPFWPVDMQYPIFQKFGENPQNYPKRQGHPGIDFATPTGSPIYAVADGKLTLSEYRASGGYGREINLLVDKQWNVIYGHESQLLFRTGDTVKRGQLIGYSGGGLEDPLRGMSTGPHLHFEVRDITKPQQYPLIGAVDPEIWLADETLLPLRDVVTRNDAVAPVETVTGLEMAHSAAVRKLRVITDLLRLRNEPNTGRDNPPVAQLFRNAVLNATGDVEGNWHKVELWVSDGDGTFLEEVKE